MTKGTTTVQWRVDAHEASDCVPRQSFSPPDVCPMNPGDNEAAEEEEKVHVIIKVRQMASETFDAKEPWLSDDIAGVM